MTGISIIREAHYKNGLKQTTQTTKQMGVSSNGSTPISHPKMIILVGKSMVVGETHHFRKPPKQSHWIPVDLTEPSLPDEPVYAWHTGLARRYPPILGVRSLRRFFVEAKRWSSNKKTKQTKN